MRFTLSWQMLGRRRYGVGIYGILESLTWFCRITMLLGRRLLASVPKSFSSRFV